MRNTKYIAPFAIAGVLLTSGVALAAQSSSSHEPAGTTVTPTREIPARMTPTLPQAKLKVAAPEVKPFRTEGSTTTVATDPMDPKDPMETPDENKATEHADDHESDDHETDDHETDDHEMETTGSHGYMDPASMRQSDKHSTHPTGPAGSATSGPRGGPTRH